ncbi:MAG: type II toxin-antitoxin system RelB/DinJ family antitoxin [Oscillospiraceae bacterium]|nr:type II toxin-antitoxin system RelB/DinJ family antitoxin [Oscillospiraceae bacterium]
MSNNTTYNIRIDSEIKKEAGELFKGMGMSLSSAINLFLTQSVIQRRLPIDNVVAQPLGEPPSDDDYISFDTWEQAKEWLAAQSAAGFRNKVLGFRERTMQ